MILFLICKYFKILLSKTYHSHNLSDTYRVNSNGFEVFLEFAIHKLHSCFLYIIKGFGWIYYNIFFELYFYLKFTYMYVWVFRKRDSKDKIDYLVHVAVWGSYGTTFLNYLAPTLLSPNNILAAKSKKIKILFTCSQDFKKNFLETIYFERLQNYYEIEFIVFSNFFLRQCLPRVLFKSSILYCVLGFMEYIAARIALLEHASLIPLFPDFIIEENFFNKIINLHKKYDSVFTTPFRSEEEGIKKHLNRKIIGMQNDEKVKVIQLSADEVVDMQCGALHQETINRIISKSKKDFSITAQLIFKDRNKIIIKAFHWTPLLIDYSILKKIKLCKLRTIDDYLLTTYSNLKSERNYFLKNANEVAVCEVSNNNKVSPLYKNPYSLDIKTLLRNYFPLIGVNENMLYALSKKIVFTPKIKIKVSCEDLSPEWFDKNILKYLVESKK